MNKKDITDSLLNIAVNITRMAVEISEKPELSAEDIKKIKKIVSAFPQEPTTILDLLSKKGH